MHCPSSENNESNNKIWEAVLNKIETPATKALFRKCGWLIYFNEQNAYAHVGIKTLTWHKLAKHKVDRLKKAFEAIYKIKIDILLECNTKPVASTKEAVPTKEQTKEEVDEPVNSLAYELAKNGVIKSIENLDGSTKALIRKCQIRIAYNELFWQIRIEASSQRILNRLVRRSERITRRLDEGLTTFVLTFCLTDNEIPFFEIDGIIKHKFSAKNKEVTFLQLKNPENPTLVHVAPAHLSRLVEK